MTKKIVKFKWLSKPEEHDYSAATSYLSLIYEESVVTAYVNKLKKVSISNFKAKDIFRASELSLLGISNSHVDADKTKIEFGQGLPPLLLVRDPTHGRVIIADGYHRLCAIYFYDEDAVVPCKIV